MIAVTLSPKKKKANKYQSGVFTALFDYVKNTHTNKSSLQMADRAEAMFQRKTMKDGYNVESYKGDVVIKEAVVTLGASLWFAEHGGLN